MANTEIGVQNQEAGTAAGAVALGALLLASLPAFSSAVRPTLGDMAALLFLVLTYAFMLWFPKARLHIGENREAATVLLVSTFFIVYNMARRAGPSESPALHLGLLPDSPVVIPWSAYLVWAGAIVSLVLSRPKVSGPVRGVLWAAVIVAVTGVFAFALLGRYYPIGEQLAINPELIVYTILQILEFGAVALLCNSVAAHAGMRRIAFRVLPIFLIVLWARHHFGPGPAEDDN